MTTLNLTKVLTDESGEATKPETTLAKALGAIMIKSGTTDESQILKFFTWALELGQKGKIELDKADASTLRKFVVEHPDLFIIVKAPVIQEIDKLKFK